MNIYHRHMGTKELQVFIMTNVETSAGLDGDCWSWNNPKQGWGAIGLTDEEGSWVDLRLLVHRAFHGEVPKGPFLVHRTCENPFCVNPEHLSLVARDVT